jgi:acyl-CoA thioester hydrolase
MSPPTAAAAGIDLTDAAGFDHWTPVTIRFSDQDGIGHVNNVAYAAYVEAGRVAWGMDLIARAEATGVDFILASLAIDYRREMHYPGTVEVGSRPVRLGTKSVTLGFGIFRDGVAVATAHSTIVFIDTENGKSAPVPDPVRTLIEADLAK